MVGGVIMTHGDDDGLRVPPAIAPYQVVILPMLRDNDGDAALLDYCEDLRGQLAAQQRAGRADPRAARHQARQGRAEALGLGAQGRAADPRGRPARRGGGQGQRAAPRPAVARGRQARLRSARRARQFVAAAAAGSRASSARCSTKRATRRDANIVRGIDSFDELAAFFAEDRALSRAGSKCSGRRPTGAALERWSSGSRRSS